MPAFSLEPHSPHSPSAASPLLGSRWRSPRTPPLSPLYTLPRDMPPSPPAPTSTSTSGPPTPSHIPHEPTPALPLMSPSSPASYHPPLPPPPLSEAALKARASYILGLAYLGLVIVLWVLSSALIQWIFEQQGDAQPFFLTYFCTSLFTLYIPTYYALQACKRTAVYQRIAPDTFPTPTMGRGWRRGRCQSAAVAARARALVLSAVLPSGF